MQTVSRTHAHRTAPFSFAALALSMVSRFTKARALARQRRALSQLDDARLADLGLTRTEVAQELTRSAWDVPQHWRS